MLRRVPFFTVVTMRCSLRRSMLARMVSVSLALSVGNAACHDPTAPLPDEGPPDELSFSMGGFASDAVTIEMQDEVVLMWRRPWNWRPGEAIDTLRAVPTSEQWHDFWIAAERAGVHRWRSRYEADVIDGVGWTLRLVAGDFALESTGANAYPDWRGREHELEMTAEFRSLRTALGNLAGEVPQAARR